MAGPESKKAVLHSSWWLPCLSCRTPRQKIKRGFSNTCNEGRTKRVGTEPSLRKVHESWLALICDREPGAAGGCGGMLITHGLKEAGDKWLRRWGLSLAGGEGRGWETGRGWLEEKTVGLSPCEAGPQPFAAPRRRALIARHTRPARDGPVRAPPDNAPGVTGCHGTKAVPHWPFSLAWTPGSCTSQSVLRARYHQGPIMPNAGTDQSRSLFPSAACAPLSLKPAP